MFQERQPEILRLHVNVGCCYTQKCRFMDKEVREISRFCCATARILPLRLRASTHYLIQKYLHLSIIFVRKMEIDYPWIGL